MDEQPNISKNIIDHRGIASHAVLAVIAFILGLMGAPASSAPPAFADPDDDLVHLTSTALDRAQTYWVAEVGAKWHDARVITIGRPEATPCGTADRESGPFYCPGDERVYLDYSFLRAISGDLARAYVVAHEIGHHVQMLRGELQGASVDIELQADCYAGKWMRSEQFGGHLATGDVDGALAEAAAVGDDRICPSCTQEQWTHGSAAQRVASVKRGLEGGSCERTP